MNGFGSLAIVLLASQLTANTAPTLPPQMPVGQQPGVTTVDDSRKSYGWDLDTQRDNELYYIIQISPERAEILLNESAYSQGNRREIASDMPKELFGIVQRVVVRIGDDVLPRNPPLEEVAKMQRLNLQASLDGLGNGRMANVESGSIVNTQRPLPSNGNRPGTSGGIGAPPASNNSVLPLSGRGTPAPGAASGGSAAFLGESRGITSNGSSSILPPGRGSAAEVDRLADASAMPGRVGDGFGAGRGGSLTPSNLPPYNSATPAEPPSLSPVPTFGSSQRFGDAASRTTSNGAQPNGTQPWGAPTNQQNQATAANAPYGSGNNGSYGQSAPDYGNAGNNYQGTYDGRQAASTPGYNPGAQPQPAQTNGYNQGQGYAQGQGYNQYTNPSAPSTNYPPADGNAARIASNTRPQQPLQQTPPPAGDPQAVTKVTPSASDLNDKKSDDTDYGAGNGATRSKSSQTQQIVTVLFLLSLVFNVYLGLLIRKLLGRYRNVLMNLRTQPA